MSGQGMDMPGYLDLLLLLAPVVLVFSLGMIVRRVGWLQPESEGGILKLLMNVFYPALILKSVLGNQALRDPANLLWPPLVGFGTVTLGFFVAMVAGRLLKLNIGEGLRTFAFAVGIYNYAYIPLPLVMSLFGRETAGVLLVHNVGCELAVWSSGILLLAGVSLREGWRRLFNPSLVTLLIAVAINISGWTPPNSLMTAIDSLAVCTVTLGLICSGAAIAPFLDKARELWSTKIVFGSCVLRLGLLPLLFLTIARHGPFSDALRQVIVVQAAMPAAMIPLVIARHYGGRPLIAAQVILGTTLPGLLLIPALLRLGMDWVLK